MDITYARATIRSEFKSSVHKPLGAHYVSYPFSCNQPPGCKRIDSRYF